MSTIPYPDDNVQNLWRKIAQKLADNLGSHNAKYESRDGDRKSDHERKALNALNAGAL